ncbi:hypothetical protein SK854_05550 [Lentzea sp. BCCO 10_0061]|uniref:Uncharacterized protein n=1 Tax=Lentzea sokolovensis TaxID=3095429 RepID=A0ABU4UQ05_9PSEU|nr:hypothetical protein [Lentzea sp. BCCO 10_0061]MDX8141568.1 hypothetical protein [Lentzea sp. BCCO 10_0061]
MEAHRDWSRSNGLLGVVAREAMTRAARGTPQGQVLQTGRVLLELARADIHGNWSQFWLHTGFPKPYKLLDAADGARPSDSTWNGVPMSSDLHASLALAQTFTRVYEMSPVVPGGLVLALVSKQDSGATRALLTNGEISHPELLEVVQRELLGVALENLDQVIAAAPRQEGVHQDWTGLAADAAGSRTPDDLDLLTVISRAGQVLASSNGPLIARVLDEFTDEARAMGTHDAQEVLRYARTGFETVEPNNGQVLFALTERPSPAVAAVLRTAGISPPLVAAGAMEQLDAAADPPSIGVPVLVWTVANLVLTLMVIGLIIKHAAGPGSWWELGFVAAAMLGPPAVSAWVPGVLSLGLAVVNPVAGLVLAVEAVLGWVREQQERRALTARTGVPLSNAEHRAWLQRRRYTAGQLAAKDRALVPFRAMRSGLSQE